METHGSFCRDFDSFRRQMKVLSLPYISVLLLDFVSLVRNICTEVTVEALLEPKDKAPSVHLFNHTSFVYISHQREELLKEMHSKYH